MVQRLTDDSREPRDADLREKPIAARAGECPILRKLAEVIVLKDDVPAPRDLALSVRGYASREFRCRTVLKRRDKAGTHAEIPVLD